MELDVIYCHPVHLVYPLWMKFIHENRNRFNKVIVSFTKMNAKGDYTQFVREQMSTDNITFVDNEPAQVNEDWRDKAVNSALRYSDSEWIWFSEQDFIPLEGFWEEIERAMVNNHSVTGVSIEKRLHPCCILITRKLLDKTSKSFGVVQDRLDHFGVLQEEITELGGWYAIPEKYWYHMNGLSQNMFMLQNGERPNYREEEFKDYCKKCLEVSLHPDFQKLFKEYLNGSI